jgi:hypothetical protein
MKQNIRAFAAAGGLLIGMFAAGPAFAQKQGGILKTYSPDRPASMSIHEEATVFAEGPMMAVLNEDRSRAVAQEFQWQHPLAHVLQMFLPTISP